MAGMKGYSNRQPNKIKIAYIGRSASMLRMLLEAEPFCVQGIICEEGRLTDGLRQIARGNGLPASLVCRKGQIGEALRQAGAEAAVMYEFGIIVPQETVRQYAVYNFHSGSLRTNRGSSPVNWSILLGDKETEMSLYRISGGIDEGMLVAAEKCGIAPSDTPRTLKEKLEGLVPGMLAQLGEHIRDNKTGEPVYGGAYRRRIREEDYTIHPQDAAGTARAKIQSQADYEGAVAMEGGRKVYIKTYREFREWKARREGGMG